MRPPLPLYALSTGSGLGIGLGRITGLGTNGTCTGRGRRTGFGVCVVRMARSLQAGGTEKPRQKFRRGPLTHPAILAPFHSLVPSRHVQETSHVDDRRYEQSGSGQSLSASAIARPQVQLAGPRC